MLRASARFRCMLVHRGWLAVLLLLCSSALVPANASDECVTCHAASANAPVHAIFNTVHGQLTTADGSDTCTLCHGDSQRHRANPGVEAPSLSYGPRWPASVALRNGGCLDCHKGGEQMLWSGSVHQQEDLSCNGCHQTHRRQDPVVSAKTEAGVCFGCHSRQRSESQLPSRHPIGEGKMRCSSCHNVHGSSSHAALRAPTLNDSCYSCHGEKRGPFLFEHAPASEDCSLCHTPHGSVNERLLTVRGPFLCQQCHMAAFHPSVLSSATSLGDANRGKSLVGKNCLNCHSQVHGSNHPSGSALTR